MHFVFTVFEFEIRQLVRSRLLLLLISFLLLTGMYGLRNGSVLIGQQQAGIDSVMRVQQQNQAMLQARFHEDTATERGRQLRSQAGIPQVVAFRNPPYAVFPPAGLSLLAIGIRDLHPYYDIISTKEDSSDDPAREFSNPELLAAGTFDLAFVLIYLFPVLVIIYCYNCWSAERELHVEPLLILHAGGVQRLLLWRFVCRYIVVFVPGIVLFVTGWLLMDHGITIVAAINWLLLWGTYLICWFAICWFVILLRRSSTWNIICLGFTWLFLVWLLPAGVNSYVAMKAPLPLKSGLVAALREEKEDTWALPIPVLLDSFFHYNPQYSRFRKSTDTAAYGNRRFMAFNDLLGRRNHRLEQAFDQQWQARMALQRRLLYINPVSYTQYYLHVLSGTEWPAIADYRLQVARFRRQWQVLMNDYLVRDKVFCEDDIRHLPGFSYQHPAERNITYQLFYLIIFSGIIILVAQFKLK